MQSTERQDIYTRITERIIQSLEQGVRPWVKPWNAENAMGRIIRPLRHNGQAYSGINVLMLWSAAVEQAFTCPMWMTFKQATEFDAHVRKGEKGSLVVYANTVTKTEDDGTGVEVEREIPFLRAIPSSMSSRSKDYRRFSIRGPSPSIPDLPASITPRRSSPTQRPTSASVEHAPTTPAMP